MVTLDAVATEGAKTSAETFTAGSALRTCAVCETPSFDLLPACDDCRERAQLFISLLDECGAGHQAIDRMRHLERHAFRVFGLMGLHSELSFGEVVDLSMERMSEEERF